MKNAAAFVLALLAYVCSAVAQYAPPVFPPNTVFGRLNPGSPDGQGQAIPFSTLATQLGVGAAAVNVINIAGAAGDGVTDDTGALASALSACSTAGGGTVVLGPKRYLINSANITVPTSCKVLCQAPLLGDEGLATPINFQTTPFTVILNPSFTITLAAGSAWSGCAVLQKNINFNPVTTRDLLNLKAAFLGIAFNVGGDVTISDTFIGGFAVGVTSTTLGGDRLRMSRVNIDATQCTQFDSINDIAYIWSLHCFPFIMSGHANSDPSYSITSVANNGSGLYRVTTSTATVIQTGDTVWVDNSLSGASSAVNKWTATFIDSTHVDLQGSSATGVTPTGTTVNGSKLVTGLSSTADIGFGSNITGTGIPGSTTVASVLYTCGCLVLSNAATASGTVTLTISDPAYASGGKLYLAADYRTGIGIEFTNNNARSVCDGCFAYNHATGFHIGTNADWIACTGCTTDAAPTDDPTQIGVLIDSSSKGSVWVNYAALAGQNNFVVNSNNSLDPHMITGSTLNSAQGQNLIELDKGALVVTGNASQVGGKWVTILDAAQSLTFTGNNVGNKFAAQSSTSQAKVVSSGNTSSHTTAIPTTTGCGTGSPTVSAQSTDFDGVVTEGTSATGCTILFNLPFTTAPNCTVTSQSALTSFAYTVPNPTGIVVTHGSASGSLINWHCASRDGI